MINLFRNKVPYLYQNLFDIPCSSYRTEYYIRESIKDSVFDQPMLKIYLKIFRVKHAYRLRNFVIVEVIIVLLIYPSQTYLLAIILRL